jgi:hypothetical protein
MFNTAKLLNKQKKDYTLSDILTKVSQYDLFKKYIGDFKIGKLYSSPFRKDSNPSFGIFCSSKDGHLLFNDLGRKGYCGDIVKFIELLFGITNYQEAINKLVDDFNITTRPIVDIHETYTNIKKDIGVIRQEFTNADIIYWSQYGIDISILKRFNVSSVKHYLVNGLIRDTYQDNNPIYCYSVFGKLKKYKPLEKEKSRKWGGNLSNYDIQGYAQLDFRKKSLIITKSLKDVMVLYKLGYNAIAPPSENTKIPEEVVKLLKQNFKDITIFYDRDVTGITNTRQLINKYKFNFIFINKKYKTKDISDFVSKFGLEKAKEFLIKYNI